MDGSSSATAIRTGIKHVRKTVSKIVHAHADVIELARAKLLGTGYASFGQLICEHDSGVLRLRGQLPNYYQKQLAQELLFDLDGVDQIVNSVEVV